MKKGGRLFKPQLRKAIRDTVVQLLPAAGADVNAGVG
jgi:hypothetical protein